MRRSSSLRKEVRESTDGFLEGTPLSSTVPSVSPSGVRVERLTSTAMNVSWTLLTLEEARGFVTSYTVSYRKDEGMAKRTTESVVVPGGEQSSVVIGGLDPGSSYLVSVSASTSAGTGEMSEPVVVPVTTTETSDNLCVSIILCECVPTVCI